MKRASLALFPLLAAASCGTDVDLPGADEPTGSVQVALASVPSDALCLKLAVSGSRSVSKSFDLAPGTSPTFTLDRLPIGNLQVDGQVFPKACAAVRAMAAPAWVTEAPVTVRVDVLEVANVVLKLIRNGRVSVAIDFEAPPWVDRSGAPVNLAVFGDTPYGGVQIADVPNFVASVNADTSIAAAVHLGDIKNGSSACNTDYFQFILDGFNTFTRPLIFTPGDNEWTDCHRANNGAYDPLERLATLRTMFYPVPGQSLGIAKKEVLSQSFFPGFETFVENTLWFQASTVFATLHVVGSNDNLLPWFGDDTTHTKMDDPARRTAEVAARQAATLDWLTRTFATATEENAKGVVLMMQADMWDALAMTNGFNPIIQKIASLTLAFGKPVLLMQGDSHLFKVDNPLAAGDAAHGVTTPVPNLTRIVVQGSNTTTLTEWLRLSVNPTATPPFSWTRITH
jgi:hypothetical protein